MATILVVDDHILNRHFLMSLLGYGGHRLLEAEDGAVALDVVRAERPDLVISDILMPEMDGYEFVSRLRADPGIAATPVIFFTATYREREAKVLADACGVKWVLAKPSEPQVILDMVQRALGLPAEDAIALSSGTPEATSKRPAVGNQFAAHLHELEATGKLMTQIAQRGRALVVEQQGGTSEASHRLSESLTDLQSVGLRLSALIELGINLAAERNPARLLKVGCHAMQNICTAKYAIVGIPDEQGDGLDHFYCRGLDDRTLALIGRPAPRGGILGMLLDSRAPHLINGLDGDPQVLGLPSTHPPVHSFLGVAIASSERIYGWIYVADKLGALGFDETEKQAAATIAAQMAVAYENLILYDEIQRNHSQLQAEVAERRHVLEQLQESDTRLRQLAGNYAVLSGINSAIARIHDRDELLQEACRVAVTQGAFSLAWAGVVDPGTLDGKVVGWFGDEPALAEKIRFTARADAPVSALPADVAVREQMQVICDDIGGEPALAALKAELLARGHRSVAAFPLIVEERAVAVIVLFANEIGFFAQDGRMGLLEELAGDLSFGLQFIDKEDRLNYLAYYDAFTGLPNSMLFQDRLTQHLLATSGSDDLAAVIVIDLAHFAQLNDAMGRHVGDAVLKMVAQRLRDALQEPYSLARVSGDTFAIAFSGLQRGADAATLLEQQILQPLNQPFAVAQQEVRISVRAGVAVYPADGRDAETLFKHAALALKKAKSSGERYLYYSPQMNAAIAARMALENALRGALEAGQFVMHYQPRVDLLSGRIIGAEALIRWQHPLRGLVAPGEFIATAEETGQIVAIGDWVIDAVCAQQAAWQAQQVGIVPVAINLSAVQFKNGKVQQTIRDAVSRHGLEQRHIEFELTESVVMDDPQEATRNLQELKDLGAQLSLDDFGTGYSSLAYLKRFPFDFVKIDRAFITDLTDNPEDAAIATAIIAMAHSLGLRVVAEGVETDSQLQFLRALGCDEMQGYYFSPPVPAAAFAVMLREGKRLALAP